MAEKNYNNKKRNFLKNKKGRENEDLKKEKGDELVGMVRVEENEAGAGLQSGVAWEPSGVSVVGNMSTLACMKERSGRAVITFAASSLRFSSFLGFLSNRKEQKNKHDYKSNRRKIWIINANIRSKTP